MVSLNTMASFPFIPVAAEWVRKSGPSLDELLLDRAYSNVRVLGKKRLLDAMERDKPIGQDNYDSDTESMTELLSYIVARMIASVVGDSYLIRRYSLAEAERAKRKLQEEPTQFVIEVCHNLGIDVDIDEHDSEEQMTMHFLTFLQNTSQMRSIDWKLVNVDVKAGSVILDKRRVCRIVQEVLRRRFEEELPLGITQQIQEAFEAETIEITEAIEEKKRQFEPEGLGEIRAECFPPCIKHLLAIAKAGENLSHMGRFTLASFLHIIGMSNDDILSMFAGSPDFKEKIARYQVDHITGVSSATEYTPPECTTMVSYGLCFEKDRTCDQEWLTHPLKYYRTRCRSARRWERRKKAETKEPKKEVEE